ncbi:MAG: acyl-CoA dehydrogenase family protein [Candidatus Dormibacteraeota bacterium]|nr:acyl-CoA dehydrogenase family protein [Candidatus Dormibacteraeota bacterium]
MDFAFSPRVVELREQLWDFMNTHVLPAEERYFAEFSAATIPHHIPPVMEELKAEARLRGLWNLFLPDERFGAGLTNLEYAPLAEITGHSLIAPEAINCSAPDTGNMEVLALFGSPEQQETWLKPLLAGEIRSCVAMTEPDVASSDPTNISTRIEHNGDELIITGRKWWTSGAAHPMARVSLLMGLSDREAEPHRRHSFVLVPMDAVGVRVVRQLQVFGYDDPGSHCEVMFDEVRVPAANLIGERGAAFAIAQARLGPGRIHHCMRVIGTAERALALMCERARTRTAFGKLLAEQGVVQQAIARSRVELEQVRLLCHKAAWLMDTQGTKGARAEIAAIKVAAPQVACDVVDRAIQVHGGAGMSNDLPLARMYAWSRALRILDGPDEVHLQSIARHELRKSAG